MHQVDSDSRMPLVHAVETRLSLLSHRCKGVVLLLGAFEDKSMIYLVFEACMRGDLYQLLMRNRGTLHEEFVVTKVSNYPVAMSRRCKRRAQGGLRSRMSRQGHALPC